MDSKLEEDYMTDKCDKCHSDILMGECSCGKWFEKGDHPKEMQTLERAIEDFNNSGKSVSSMDHFSGSCAVFFKGDYKKCMIVVDFIRKLTHIKSQLTEQEWNESELIFTPEKDES